MRYEGTRSSVGNNIISCYIASDNLIENCIVIENKTVEQLAPIHEAQLLTYLKLGDYNLGFLLNWNSTLIKHGIKRIVNNLPERAHTANIVRGNKK